MSAETLERLRQAVEAHVTDETGNIVGSWVVLAETTTLDELEHGYSTFYAEKRGNSFCLQGIASAWLHNETSSYVLDDEEDD